MFNIKVEKRVARSSFRSPNKARRDFVCSLEEGDSFLSPKVDVVNWRATFHRYGIGYSTERQKDGQVRFWSKGDRIEVPAPPNVIPKVLRDQLLSGPPPTSIGDDGLPAGSLNGPHAVGSLEWFIAGGGDDDVEWVNEGGEINSDGLRIWEGRIFEPKLDTAPCVANVSV